MPSSPSSRGLLSLRPLHEGLLNVLVEGTVKEPPGELELSFLPTFHLSSVLMLNGFFKGHTHHVSPR